MPAQTDLDQKDYLGPISASPQVQQGCKHQRALIRGNQRPTKRLLQYVAEALVEFAKLTPEDVLFDLGCNDGELNGYHVH